MSDHEDEEILRRRAREQAEIERQTDALVLRTLTSMVTASEELKAKLRRDTESLLEGYRRTKRQLENEIAMATAERVRSRREAEQERAEIIREARAQAREIVEAAKRERETMLTEARAMEQRLRGLEDQIRSVFGQGFAGLDAKPEIPSPSPSAPPTSFIPGDLAALRQLSETPAPTATDSDDAISTTADTPADDGRTVADEPVASSPVATGPEDRTEPPAEAAPPAAADNLSEPSSLSAMPSTPMLPSTPAPPPAAAPSPVASFTPSAPAPAPDRPARPTPFPIRAYASQPAPARRRPVELVFDGVPGYQQASALERAVNDLLPNEEIDILQFDRGQLVLGLHATDLERLADQLVAGSPASLELGAVAGDRATFRCI